MQTLDPKPRTIYPQPNPPNAGTKHLGRLVIVGDEIDFIQRIVVDPGVTSQEISPGRVVVVQSLSADGVELGLAGFPDGGKGLTAYVLADGANPSDKNYATEVKVTPKSVSHDKASFDFPNPLLETQSYLIQFKDAQGNVVGSTERPALKPRSKSQ